MLLIEIALIAVAWRKGWRWRALIPAGIGFAVAFLMGAAIAASGGHAGDAAPLLVLLDVGIVVSLIVLAFRSPRPSAAISAAPPGAPEPLTLSSGAEGRV